MHFHRQVCLYIQCFRHYTRQVCYQWFVEFHHVLYRLSITDFHGWWRRHSDRHPFVDKKPKADRDLRWQLQRCTGNGNHVPSGKGWHVDTFSPFIFLPPRFSGKGPWQTEDHQVVKRTGGWRTGSRDFRIWNPRFYSLDHSHFWRNHIKVPLISQDNKALPPSDEGRYINADGITALLLLSSSSDSRPKWKHVRSFGKATFIENLTDLQSLEDDLYKSGKK